MSKVHRGGYVFLSWKGDHAPRHVHIYRDGRFVAKWDLENEIVMEGRVTTGLVEIIHQLQKEGQI